MPVSTGRVSSRDAERATVAIVSTNAAAGTSTTASSVRLAEAAGSPRRAACGCGTSRRPATSSTSCSAARSSSVDGRRPAARGRRRAAAAPAARRRRRARPRASSGTRRPTSMSVARSSMAPLGGRELDAGERLDGAAGRGDAGDGLELRRGARRATSRASRWSTSRRRIDVIGAVEVCDSRADRAAERGAAGTADCGWRADKSVRRSRSRIGCRRARVRRRVDSVVRLGVGGDALGGALAGVQDRGVVAAAEGAADRREASRRSARARGTWRPGAARRRGRARLVERSSSRREAERAAGRPPGSRRPTRRAGAARRPGRGRRGPRAASSAVDRAGR